MNHLVSQFQTLVNKTNSENPGSSVELLLASLKPEIAWFLRVCAIPHHFTPAILRVLKPTLNTEEAEARYVELSALPVSIYLEERVAIHDEARNYLFEQWLRSDGLEFALHSQRLAEYFRSASQNKEGILKKYLEIDEMFHLIGVDQSVGLARFQQLWTEDYLECGLSSCKSLLTLVREYQSVLTPEWCSWLTYYEACLQADSGEVTDAIKTLQKLQEHVSTREIKLQIQIRRRLGCLLGMRAQWDASIAILNQALAIAEQDARQDELQSIWHELGAAYREVGEVDQARNYYQKSLDRATEQRDLSTMALALNGLGTLALALGESKEGIAHLEKSLEWIDRAGDNFRKAEVYNNLGTAHAQLREWDQAEIQYLKSLEIKEQVGGTRGRARSLNNLVQVYLNQNQPQDALVCGNSAAAFFLEVQDYIGAAEAKCNVGLIYCKLDQDEQSQRAYIEAAELFRKGGELIQASEAEMKASRAREDMPWWVWAAIMLFIISILSIIV